MARVVAVLLELLAQLEEPLSIDVDTTRGAARVILPDDQQHRSANVLYVGQRVALPVLLGHLGWQAPKERVVVFLQRLHLVLVGREVVADGNDGDPERPALRLRAEAKEREIAAPGSTREDDALRIGDAVGDQAVLHLRDVLDLGESRPPN